MSVADKFAESVSLGEPSGKRMLPSEFFGTDEAGEWSLAGALRPQFVCCEDYLLGERLDRITRWVQENTQGRFFIYIAGFGPEDNIKAATAVYFSSAADEARFQERWATGSEALFSYDPEANAHNERVLLERARAASLAHTAFRMGRTELSEQRAPVPRIVVGP